MFMKAIDCDKVSESLGRVVSAPEFHQEEPKGLKCPQTFKFLKLARVTPTNQPTLAILFLAEIDFQIKA